jgi:hypothetical protein
MQDLNDPATRIETQEVAVARLEGLCARLKQLRNTMDASIPGNESATRKIRVKAEQHWLMTFGQAVGTLSVFRRLGLLSLQAYQIFFQKISEAFRGNSEAMGPRAYWSSPLTQEGLELRIQALCQKVVQYRDRCNVVIPDDPETTAREQYRAYQRWNIYYGRALGALIAYRQASQIEDRIYEAMKARIQGTLASRVVGSVQVQVQPPRGKVRLV